MTSLPAWQIRRLFQSYKPEEHRSNTASDPLRASVVLAVLQDSSIVGEANAERCLHMYLNECRTTTTQAWYEQTQALFLRHHADWAPVCDAVFMRRGMHGSKSQKNNITGDWLALSHLRGEPLAFEPLAINKRGHPRGERIALLPRDDIAIKAPMPKEGLYREVFALLYKKHGHEHNAWQALLRRTNLQGMTGETWDAFVDLYPDETSLPFKGMVKRAYEWECILKELSPPKHARVLARAVVELMQSGQANELYEHFDKDMFSHIDACLETPTMSEALYEAFHTDPNLRLKLSVAHLINAINADPSRAVFELDYAASSSSKAYISANILTWPYLIRLNTPARKTMFSALVDHPERYATLVDALVDSLLVPPSKSEGLAPLEDMDMLLASSWIQAKLVESILDDKANDFLAGVASRDPAITVDLEAADFEQPYAFETIMMRHVTPTLTYEQARSIRAMGESLGIPKEQTRALYQAALEGAAVQKSLSIDGLVDTAISIDSSLV